jgi:hypothetical protein
MSVQILSVLDKLRADRRPATLLEEEDKGPKFLLDQSEINDIVDRELGARTLSPDRQAASAKFRTWVKDFRIPYDGIIGQVDGAGLVRIVTAAIEGQYETIRNQQPNGDWKILGAERVTKKLDRVTYLRVGVLWVDASGKEDLVYVDGKPASSVNVKVQTQALPPEVVDLLKQGAGGGMNDALVRFLTAQTALMEAQAASLRAPTFADLPRSAQPEEEEEDIEPPEGVAADDPAWLAAKAEAAAPVKRGPGRPRKVVG